MKICSTAAALFVVLPTWVSAQGTFAVRFDQSSYAVSPGQTFTVATLIDPIPPGGLFSFGVQLLFQPTDVRIASDRAIVVPIPLDFNGPAGPGALRAITSDSAGVKGSVDPIMLPPQAYTGSTFASFEVADISLAPGKSYQIRLGLFRTLGETESVFVSGTGEQLDGNLSFGMATIEVIPEPGVVSLVFASALMIGLLARPTGLFQGSRRLRRRPLTGRVTASDVCKIGFQTTLAGRECTSHRVA